MPRPQRSLVALCIGVIALAPLLAGMSALFHAVLDLQWVVLADEVCAGDCTHHGHDAEQPLALFCHLPSRAPPSGSLA